jgi:hypothetical protein
MSFFDKPLLLTIECEECGANELIDEKSVVYEFILEGVVLDVLLEVVHLILFLRFPFVLGE